MVIAQPVLTFDPAAADNLAVYFGHSPGNLNASLAAVCNSSSVDIVVLGFVRNFVGPDWLPTFDLNDICQSVDDQANCSSLADDVSSCQRAGKKVFLSIGGSTSNTSFDSATDATQAAQTLWDYFGSGNETISARPLGSIELDGFDIGMWALIISIHNEQLADYSLLSTRCFSSSRDLADITEDHEQGTALYYDTFAATLKSLYASASKDYYLSVSPSCANTTVVYPPSFFDCVDFIWPRFYNAKACNTASSGFASSLLAWSQQLDRQVGHTSPLPKLYIGAVDFDTGTASNGFLQPHNFTEVAIAASCLVRKRFGGVMLWDATNGLETIEGGENFLDITKAALVGKVNCSGTAALSYGNPRRLCYTFIVSLYTSLYNCKFMNV